jgi:hypothetical protein
VAVVIYPLVVDEPVWNDDLDSTFITFPAGTFTAVARSGALESGLDAGTVTAITVRVRARLSAGPHAGFLVYAEGIPGTFGLPRTAFDYPGASAAVDFPTGVITTVEADLYTSFGEEDPLAQEGPQLAEWLAATSYEVTVTHGSLGSGLIVYELAVLVYTFADDDQPPLRLYPRDDGLGMSTAPRIIGRIP